MRAGCLLLLLACCWSRADAQDASSAHHVTVREIDIGGGFTIQRGDVSVFWGYEPLPLLNDDLILNELKVNAVQREQILTVSDRYLQKVRMVYPDPIKMVAVTKDKQSDAANSPHPMDNAR